MKDSITDQPYIQQTPPKKKSKKRIWTQIILLIVILASLITAFGFYMRHQFLKAAYPVEYEQIVNRYAAEYDFAPSLIFAVIRTESSFNPDALSHAGAMGLMQLTPDTFEWAQRRMNGKAELETEQLYDAETNIKYGVYTLRLLRQYFQDSDTATILAAYNAGLGNVERWLKDEQYSADGKNLDEIPYGETKNYSKTVPKTRKMYQKLYEIE